MVDCDMEGERPKIKKPVLTPAEEAVRRGKISVADLRKRRHTSKPLKIKVQALSEQEFEARTQRIKNEWGSVSNFCSAMIWYFTQGFVDAQTTAGIRTSWETRWSTEEFQELSEEEIKRALQNKAFLDKLKNDKAKKTHVRDFSLEKDLLEELRSNNALDKEKPEDALKERAEGEREELYDEGLLVEGEEVPLVQSVDMESLRDFIFGSGNKI